MAFYWIVKYVVQVGSVVFLIHFEIDVLLDLK